MPKSGTEDLAVAVGKAIAKQRIASGLTQEKVAERLGIGLEAVSRMERGTVIPTVVRLFELADIFACDAADLLTEASNRSSDQASHLNRLLSRLSTSDRAMLLEVFERLSTRLTRRETVGGRR
ncbi:MULTISPECIES: helix-turn-helix domain-containing protein [Burkholderia cepacia complex]|jgi:transcriptional regulator with XRE-family HTH domain|uniref:DNA-binding protein n=1 Tax=Burkholderia cenocepacia (strain ATCC BAA-245 / DSM 16553 / LMG 16656 / NCTC 13227 / J2315 / CF5610) TaxID=216591 RepID=B4EEC9_BURCJ|nr:MULTISPECIES: helix-turn-helix transcriptional regulator [Burkholderia cepacia complex]KIS47452.1 helix-turn-helix family protein [Burkholderia cepacia]ERI30694.1 DNA-binding helix-turn-helix protein [Burkholderia cenocepacia BC7]KKI79575.1 DNA-binding protein [Burkholderia cenocepacia]KOE25249.1 DNA-binding protein [Burkholderia multivorans R-20526]MBU9304553.1 helix-turn-helix domain-containing protein [Burkholderia multivorans]